MKRLTLALGLLALAAVLAACSGASAGSSSPAPSSGTPADISLVVAKDLKFSQTQLSVKAGTAFTIDFDNQESAPHNVAINDAGGASVFKGDIVASARRSRTPSRHSPPARTTSSAMSIRT